MKTKIAERCLEVLKRIEIHTYDAGLEHLDKEEAEENEKFELFIKNESKKLSLEEISQYRRDHVESLAKSRVLKIRELSLIHI